MIRSHQARPLADATEDRIPRADIDFSTGTVHLDGAPWLHPDQKIPAEAVAQDARLLVEYLNSFLAFFGNAAGAVEVYWAFLVWLYAAPAAPYLRQAAVPVGIDPWVYPVYAVLFGRSSGGKTLFTKVAARSMFGFEKMIRSGQFTANRAIGLRDRLGAIPLLIDDVTRDKFSSHVPDLVRTDHEMSAQYAPVVLTTNRDVSTIPPDLTKRMVTCHIDAAIAPPHTIWIDQCEATETIKARYGVSAAFDYLVAEKLLNFAEAARQPAAFAQDLPRFVAEVRRIFTSSELEDEFIRLAHTQVGSQLTDAEFDLDDEFRRTPAEQEDQKRILMIMKQLLLAGQLGTS